MSVTLLALIEVQDRHGHVQARLPVTHWPVMVGRDLNADLVLDDPHVAALHLRLEQFAPGCVAVQVLDTRNGADLSSHHHARDAQFDWLPGQTLTLGRTHLQLRLADSALAAEQALPQWHWHTTLWTLALLTMTVVLRVGQLWFKSTETKPFLQALPSTLLGMLGALSLWGGMWALASKLFSGQPQFWRHVRIACAILLASFCVDAALELLAFMFSLETLARLGNLAALAVLALGLYRHLLVVAPKRGQTLAWGMGLLLVGGVFTIMGTQWLQNKRLTPQLYMNQLYPPSWRMAKTVPVTQFLQEAASIEQRLAERLADQGDANASDDSSADDE